MFLLDFLLSIFFFYKGLSFVKEFYSTKNISYFTNLRAYSFTDKGIQIFLSTIQDPLNAIQVKKTISLQKLNKLKRKKKIYALLELDSYNNEYFSLSNSYSLFVKGIFLLIVSFVFLIFAYIQFNLILI